MQTLQTFYMMNENYYPRTLVVSNNGFSLSSNNGRTLGNLFVGWPKTNIAQFCVSCTEPDYEICDNYFLLTDKSVLNAFLHLKKGERSGIITCSKNDEERYAIKKRTRKTPLSILLRHFIWKGKRWDSKDFRLWIDGFNPEVVLLMNSDATFILDIALHISKYKNIPLVLFNTEGYYFLKNNRFKKKDWISNHIFYLYQKIYRRHFRKMMEVVSSSIHLNSMLKDDYQSEFGGKHMVLYTSSCVNFDTSKLNLEKPVFSYLGNFSFDRPSALIEVAEVLQSISSDYYLDVYGKINNQVDKQRFDECNGIRYHGMIPYEKVVTIIHNSTILFHAETQERYFKESLRYGFSTKIADSIASGHPFLIYSSSDIAGAKYIIESKAGWYAGDKQHLRDSIISILNDEHFRNKTLSIARKTAEENHNAEKNAFIFKKELIKAITK